MNICVTASFDESNCVPITTEIRPSISIKSAHLDRLPVNEPHVTRIVMFCSFYDCLSHRPFMRRMDGSILILMKIQ